MKKEPLFNRKWGKYVYLIPSLFILALMFFYVWWLNASVDGLLREKLIEKQLDIDLICSQTDAFIEFDNDWETYDYERILGHSVALVDAQPFTFAALYTERLENVSARTASYASLYEPLENAAFVDTVRTHESGNYTMPYKPPDSDERDMYIYYRWIPTSTELSGRYLAIVAISEYSIINSPLELIGWVLLGIFALISVASFIVTAGFSQFGYIWSQRKGDKWRSKGGVR